MPDCFLKKHHSLYYSNQRVGSVNFSRIESAQLELLYNIPNGKVLPQGTWYVNARSFNELRIKGGMGGKRFAS